MDNQPSGTLLQLASDRLVRSVIAQQLNRPYDIRVPAMGRLLSRRIAPLVGWRRRARRQIAWIYPDLPTAQVNALADEVADNTGRTLIELYSGAEFSARMAQTPLMGPGLEPLKQAREAGRPVLFVTGHFGNHEAARHALVARGYQIGGLYRPMKNPYFNDHYARTMTDLSGPVFAQGKRGTIGFARHLKSGGMATLLFDVWDGNGPLVDFLGQPAPTSLSAAELALRSDALMIPYFGTRKPDGLSFDVEIEAPIAPSDPMTMMREATARLEARVAAHPGQWFWTHRRWKPERQSSGNTA